MLQLVWRLAGILHLWPGGWPGIPLGCWHWGTLLHWELGWQQGRRCDVWVGWLGWWRGWRPDFLWGWRMLPKGHKLGPVALRALMNAASIPNHVAGGRPTASTEPTFPGQVQLVGAKMVIPVSSFVPRCRWGHLGQVSSTWVYYHAEDCALWFYTLKLPNVLIT